MQHRIGIALQLVIFLVIAVLSGTGADPQNNAPPSLQEQLEAQYELTKINGSTVVPGTPLVILKDGIISIPLSNPGNLVIKFEDGTLHGPSAAALAQFGKDRRPISKGEKIYVTKITVNAIEDWVRLQIVECGPCNGVLPTPAYKSIVGFQFAKGYLKKGSVPDIEDAIAQVFDVYNPPKTPSTPAPEPSGIAPTSSGQALTNNDILKLVAVKLPEAIILAKIQSSPCAFDTSTDEIVRLKQSGVSDTILQAMVNAGSQPVGANPPAPVPDTPARATCTDYNSCMGLADSELADAQWDQALANLQKAATFEPSKPDAWADLGNVYLATGQYQNAVAMWDKVLGLGSTLAFKVWHYKPGRYEQGIFYLGPKEVSYVIPGGEKFFSVAPTEVSSVKSHHPPLARDAWSFGMKAGGHNYWFSYMPLGAQCESPIRCSGAAGYSQEEAVSNYVAQTLLKLAPGSADK